ncbi:MAG: 2-enoyl thioester reductase domain-containing protein [Verrucomicrobiales bacterium]|nr:2-enoyl thioester reductase domain-containing protein [Verrucomicrobiales bacterium]
MSEINRQIKVAKFSTPEEGASFCQEKIRCPDPEELLIRTQYAPINPADLNVIEGKYGKLPQLPAIIGNEGSGQVVDMGGSCEGFAKGDYVFYVNRNDCWQDYVRVHPNQVIKVPESLSPKLSAMLKVNPATAWLLLNQTEYKEPDSWLVQNAANSGVGIAVIEIAKLMGWKTINFVRRADLKDELIGYGADLVVTDNDDGKNEAVEIIGKDQVSLAINAVGGDSALRIMSLLSEGGTHITYGAMAKRPLKIPNSFLIFKDLRIQGLWLSKWLNSTSPQVMETVYGKLADMMLHEKLHQPIDSIFRPEQIKSAIKRSMETGRDGKVLLDFSS